MKIMKDNQKLPSSFRDPSGHVFFHKNTLYRQINPIYQNHYEALMRSGLYKKLVREKLLIPHTEIDNTKIRTKNAYKIIKPEKIPFISYPFEWCFSQLKDAALTTLAIQKRSLDFDISLKDASAYNIQFRKGKPILIDTLSFERYQKGKPWIAYRQFCQHFLAPLALMSYTDVRLNQLLRLYIDGVPLDLASTLLPFRAWLKLSLFSHIRLHSKSQKYFADKTKKPFSWSSGTGVSRLGLLGLIDSLESAVKKLKLSKQKTQWSNYYQETNYTKKAFEDKKRVVAKLLHKLQSDSIWDLGANTGIFSRIAASQGVYTISIDSDPLAVELNYLECQKRNEKNILPLVANLTNPSPAIGWENQERSSLINRGPADLVLALALVHHLAIGNNLPFAKIARFFSLVGKSFIIEFIPKEDSQCQRLLSRREDIFTGYTRQGFEKEFGKFFKVVDCEKIKDSKRWLYLMKL